MCGPGQTFCSGQGCVALNTNTNCGACGAACTGGTSCGTLADGGVGCVACSGVQSQCNAFLATVSVSGHPPTHTTCSPTELAIFQKHANPDSGMSTACLQCAFTNAVIDLSGVSSNQDCIDLGATGDGGTPAGFSQCLNTLTCDLGLNGAGTDSCGGQLYTSVADPMGTLLLNAFCGAGVSMATCNSTPMGVCASQWQAGFQGLSNATIQTSNSNTAFPSGMANFVAGGLLSNCSAQCFP
jgi:hypothetical protein